MRGFVANTDFEWFMFLRVRQPLEEANFWQPSGGDAFRALQPGRGPRRMLRKLKGNDPVQARLDRIIELLEDLVMLQGRHYGISRDELRAIVSLDAKRVSRVTQSVIPVLE